MKPLLITLLGVSHIFLANGQAGGAEELHSAISPVPRGGNWVNRHESFNEKVAANQGNIDLVFIGDSITQGWERRGKLVWDTYYAHRKALNLGIGGDRTQHVLWRLDNGNLKGIQPKVGVVMIGTNNSADDRNTAAEMVDGVRAIIEKLRAKAPEMKILLLGIFPRGKEFNAQRGKILQVNQALSRLHDGAFLFYRDIGGHFVTDTGEISPSIMPDYLHLSTAGYGLWARGIESFISQHLGDTPVTVEHVDVAGDWSFEITGPDGPVTAAMSITTDGVLVEGTVAMGPDRVLPFTSGGRFKDLVHFQIVRDRPQGGNMTYNLIGTIADGQLKGEVTARLDGETTTIPWTATR